MEISSDLSNMVGGSNININKDWKTGLKLINDELTLMHLSNLCYLD